MVPFSRSLGAQSGVQLNPVLDNTQGFVPGQGDQTFAMAARFQRGRIDKAFAVNGGNLYRKLGQPTSPNVDPLNEAFIHAYEAFNPGTNGAVQGVISRLITTSAVLDVVKCTAAVPGNTPVTGADVWSAVTSLSGSYLFGITHLECYNDGVYFEINAPQVVDSDNTPQPATVVTINMRDPVDNSLIYTFTGSLSPTAKDAYGQSYFIGDMIAKQTDAVTIAVAMNATVPVDCGFYGNDTNGNPLFLGLLVDYFTEGGTGYLTSDYDNSINQLRYTPFDYGYIEAGGTQSVALLSRLLQLGYNVNTQCIWDVPGSYSVAEAQSFVQSVNPGSQYSQVYWAPLLTDDPVNGGKAYIGTGGIQVGMRCARNAAVDGNGLPKLNYPIAGAAYPITSRTGIIQSYTPTDPDLNALALACINPVIYVAYNSGSKYVFYDSLTGYPQAKAAETLIAVAEMSSQNDLWISQYSKESLQLPMNVTIKRIADFMQVLFEAEQAAGWIQPTPTLGNVAFTAQVVPNPQSPEDTVDVTYTMRYVGTTRVVTVTQTITR